MTTAHRPTFDPARGKDALRGPGYHQRLLPAHKTLKFRQATQGTTDEHSARDLRAELLRAERRHFAKKEGREPSPEEEQVGTPQLALEQAPTDAKNLKRSLENGKGGEGSEGEQEEEDYEAKRRRVLEETRDVDADSDDGSEQDSDSSDDEDDDDDEEAELMRELAKIKAERAEAAAREAAEQAAKEEEQQMRDIATGNPLLNKGKTIPRG